MSISEAPGRMEYELNACYQGAAGKFWEGILSTVGLTRDIIYTANAVMCRPMYGGKSNKLTPNLEEVGNCKPYLLQQIAIIKPKLILVFGKVAAFSLGLCKEVESLKYALGHKKYNYLTMDGETKECDTIVTYHPSYLMKPFNTEGNAITYEHMLKAKEIIDGMVRG